MNKQFYRSLLKESIINDLDRWTLMRYFKERTITCSSPTYSFDISFTVDPVFFFYRLYQVNVYDENKNILNITIGPIFHPILFILCHRLIRKLNKKYIQAEKEKIREEMFIFED